MGWRSDGSHGAVMQLMRVRTAGHSTAQRSAAQRSTALTWMGRNMQPWQPLQHSRRVTIVLRVGVAVGARMRHESANS